MKSVVILGPTASGKTGLSLVLCNEKCEIVSADSVQVYRYLNVGSGKLSEEKLLSTKHHLVSIVDPDFNFTAGEFCRRADVAAKEILNDDKIPVFVGGTGLYIDSFFQGMSNIPVISDEVRMKIADLFQSKDKIEIFELLSQRDPVYAKKIHQNDKQRIMRALEVFEETGKPLSYFHLNRDMRESEDTLYIGLNPQRDRLRQRIDSRVDEMIDNGFFEEVESLRNMGYSRDLKSMSSIGYREINDYFDGFCSKNDAIEKIKTVTKQYAKRQMTWFRKNKKINWFSPDEIKNIEQIFTEWQKKH